MSARIVTEFLASDGGRPFGPMGKDAPDILEAFLEAAERPAEQLDRAAVDRALQSVVPRMKKVRLADAPDLVGAFLVFMGLRGLPDAAGLSQHARERGRELGKSDEEKRQPVRKTAPEVGRNEACPCGSGRKYKKCCGA